ncbi:MAG: hypothetical protein ABI925_01625 [Verrucomicrobiota bacterium]
MSSSKSTEETATGVGERPPDSSSEDAGDRKIVYLDRIEWIIAILLSAIVLFWLIARTTQAGPLWRDECDSLQLARMPRFADLLENLHYTSFPLLFPVIVRAYTTLFGTSDIGVRYFGLAVGVLFLGVAWFQSRSINREVPLLLPALIGLNVNFLTAGLWLRGYGLGCVLIVLAFVLTTKFLLQPNAPRLIAVFLAYLASMQCLFFNGVLVPAIVLAAAVVFLVRGERKWMWLLLGAAAICGLSYLPYILKVYFSISNWAMLLQLPFSFRMAGRQFVTACGELHPIMSILWLGTVSLCVIGGIWRLKIAWNTNGRRERDLLLFGLLAIPLSILAYGGFLRVLHNTILLRHYLALLCIIAAATALIAANFSPYYWLRLGRIALVVMAMFTLLFVPWTKINQRQSNIDIIARQVEKDGRPSDLIVVNPWSVGISFNHYYLGTNRWITVPAINDHQVHRYDLLRTKMMEFFPLDDVERDIAATLKSGNRVWIVGEILQTPPGRSPLVLAPAPDPKFGWQSSVYVKAWSREVGAFIRRHAVRVNPIVRRNGLVSERENILLLACDGWR